MWVQQLAKIGLMSLNKLNTPENVADLLTKHVPRAVLTQMPGPAPPPPTQDGLLHQFGLHAEHIAHVLVASKLLLKSQMYLMTAEAVPENIFIRTLQLLVPGMITSVPS